MALTQLGSPYPVFTDLDGTPLDGGFVYIGVADDNPETAPILVYYDQELTQIAPQPLRTVNGYVMRNGAPAILYADATFSVTVRNRNGALVLYAGQSFGFLPGGGLRSQNNLSDVDSAATSLQNLGLTATAAELNTINDKAPLASPALTGTPTAPTPAAGADTTQIATTAFVQDALSSFPVERLSQTVISGSPANVDFTFDESLYDEVYFVLNNVVPSVSASLLIRTSNDDGATYDSGASDYRYTFNISENDATGASSNGTTGFSSVAVGLVSATASDGGLSGKLSVIGPSLTARTPLDAVFGFAGSTGDYRTWRGSGQRAAAEAVNGVQFLWTDSRTFQDGGVITAYGVRKP